MAPLVGIVYLGGYWLAALALFIGLMGIHEFFDGFRAMKMNPSEPIAYVAITVLYMLNVLGTTGAMGMDGLPVANYVFAMAWLAAVIMAGSVYMFNVTKRTPMDAMATIVGIVYIGFFSYHVVLVDGTGEYSVLIWLVLLSAFGADIFAYFTGVFLGKHKMAPNLSPKKTIEGALGGIAGSGLVCGLFGYFFCPQIVIHCTLIGLLGAPVSMCGDLTASAYKRKMGIKDYGKLIPGHGGIMDRFDSVLFTAPFVYYYIVIVLQNFKVK